MSQPIEKSTEHPAGDQCGRVGDVGNRGGGRGGHSSGGGRGYYNGRGGGGGYHGNGKRKAQDITDGDRYCTSCNYLIYGQAKDKISHCPRNACKLPIKFESADYRFSDGWAKCVSKANCGVIIHESMFFCYMCGFPNDFAWKKKDRDNLIMRAQEKKQALLEKQAMAAKIALLEEENRAKAECIKSQEAELFKSKMGVEMVDFEKAGEDLNEDEAVSSPPKPTADATPADVKARDGSTGSEENDKV